MPWHSEYRADASVVHTTFLGQVPPTELRAAAMAGLALAARHGAHLFLTDLRQLEGGHSVFDLYALAESLRDLRVPPTTREALVLPTAPSAASDAGFWETVCRNRGFEVRGFADQSSALDWLRGEVMPASRCAPPVASASPSG
ncbi:MAG: hypothetical protein K2Y51_20215 [Gammaproteobacteria bacterium]|nr:hypothetical protein [Gammaproteobacteria bacterium]